MTASWQLGVVASMALLGCATPPAPDGGNEPDAAIELPDSGLSDAGADGGSTLLPVWYRVSNTPVASGLWGSELAFDPLGRRFIMHGGNTYPAGSVIADTWSYSIVNDTWTQLSTTGATPPVRYCHCTTLLPDQRQVLIVGGRDESSLVTSAFILDLATNQWTQLQGTVPAGVGCVARWMPSRGRALVFGGDSMSGTSNATWLYDPVARTFERLTPAMPPPARRDAMHMLDPASGKVVMFGGAARIRSSYLNDVATFDGAEWAAVPPTTPRPSPRRYSASGFDPLTSRWMIFGGTNDTDDFGDLYLVDPATLAFVEASNSGAPSPRAFAPSAVDPVTGHLYIFGGLQTAGFTALGEGWVLLLDRR